MVEFVSVVGRKLALALDEVAGNLLGVLGVAGLFEENGEVDEVVGVAGSAAEAFLEVGERLGIFLALEVDNAGGVPGVAEPVVELDGLLAEHERFVVLGLGLEGPREGVEDFGVAGGGNGVLFFVGGEAGPGSWRLQDRDAH